MFSLTKDQTELNFDNKSNTFMRGTQGAKISHKSATYTSQSQKTPHDFFLVSDQIF